MTVINGLPVKNKMKNVFLENHVFTRFNLVMHYYKCYMLYVKKAYIFELSWMYVTHFINFFPNKSCFKPSNCNIVDFKKYTSPPFCCWFCLFFPTSFLPTFQIFLCSGKNEFYAQAKFTLKAIYHLQNIVRSGKY